MYWLIFCAVFLSLCAREGKRAKGDSGLSRLLRGLYEFGSRNAKKKDGEADGEEGEED